MTANDNLVVPRVGSRSEIEDEKEKKNAVFACGHSILNRTSRTDVAV
jgi:hypothetical protein